LATFSWLNPLLKLGYSKHLTEQDVPLLRERGKQVYKRFDAIWRSLGAAPSISAALLRNFWASVLLMGVLMTMGTVASFVGPYLIEDFVEFLGGRRRFAHEGAVLVGIFFVANAVGCLVGRYYNLGMFQFNQRVRTCLTTVIYRKVSSAPPVSPL